MRDEKGRYYTVKIIFGKPVHFCISKAWDGWAYEGKRKIIGRLKSNVGLTHYVIWRLMISY